MDKESAKEIAQAVVAELYTLPAEFFDVMTQNGTEQYRPYLVRDQRDYMCWTFVKDGDTFTMQVELNNYILFRLPFRKGEPVYPAGTFR